jgi:Rhs element Vgr protein
MILPGTAQAQNTQTDNVAVTVKIDGKDVTMDPGGLLSLSIGMELNKIPWARIAFSDGSVDKQSFDKSNSDAFAPGKPVELLLGYDQNQSTIFKGIIIRHSVKVLTGRPYRLEIECRDVAVKMTVVRKSHYFYDQSDSNVVSEVLQDYPDLTAGNVADTGTSHPQLVQYRATDWDFLLLRADANGRVLRLSNGTLDMIKPAIKGTADLQVQFGMAATGLSILEFESALDVRDHYQEVKGSCWDSSQQQVLDETAQDTSGTAKNDFPDVLYKDNPVLLYHPGDLESQDLTDWVNARLQRGRLSKAKGRAMIKGIAANAGDTLQVSGVGDRFNGTHLITGVLHQVVRGQWTTDIQFGWDREFFSEGRFGGAENQRGGGVEDTASLVAGVRGLQTGIVSKIGGDDVQGNHRIQVRLPYVATNSDGSQADGIWVRLGCIYAGDKRGMIFRPEIGDEVIVGFVNGDPNDGVVLASVHSTKNVAPDPPITMSDSNPVKGFVAKGGMQLLFDDDGKKITISAGGDDPPKIELDASGKTINITLDDSNSIQLSSSGVTIKGTRIDLN